MSACAASKQATRRAAAGKTAWTHPKRRLQSCTPSVCLPRAQAPAPKSGGNRARRLGQSLGGQHGGTRGGSWRMWRRETPGGAGLWAPAGSRLRDFPDFLPPPRAASFPPNRTQLARKRARGVLGALDQLCPVWRGGRVRFVGGARGVCGRRGGCSDKRRTKDTSKPSLPPD